MVLEGLRGYLQIASGLTDVTRQRATSVAQSLISQGSELSHGLPLVGDLREQVSGVAEDLLATSRANREMLLGLVRGEVERQVTRLGLVSASELEAATKRAQRLEVRVHDLEVRVAAQPAARAASAGGAPRAPRASASEPATPAPATPAAATKAPARKSTATKTATKKTPATKAPARKASGPTTSATGGGTGEPVVAAAPTPGERRAAKKAVSGARARTSAARATGRGTSA